MPGYNITVTFEIIENMSEYSSEHFLTGIILVYLQSVRTRTSVADRVNSD